MDAPAGLSLSIAQKRIWALLQIGRDEMMSWSRLIMHHRGELNLEHVDEAIIRLAKRHRVLCSRFCRLVGGYVEQRLDTLAVPTLEFVDLRGYSSEDLSVQREFLLGREPAFDPAHDLPAKVLLVQSARDEYVFAFWIHPIICDSASLRFLARDFVAIYEAVASRRPVNLPTLESEEVNRSRAEQDWLRSGAYQEALHFWRRRLGPSEAGEVPSAATFPTLSHGEAGTKRWTEICDAISVDATTQLNALAASEGLPLTILLHAVVGALLFRYTGRRESAFGIVVENRSKTDQQIGFFENIFIIAPKFHSEMTLLDVARRVSEELSAAALHKLPFERLLQDYNESEFDQPRILIRAIHAHWPEFDLCDEGRFWAIDVARHCQRRGDIDVVFTTCEDRGQIRFAIEFQDGLFDRNIIADAASDLRKIAELASRTPSVPLSGIDLADPEALTWLSASYEVESAYDDRSIHELIAASASVWPNTPAIFFGDDVWTHGELESRSNRLAHRLRGIGAGPERCVAVALRRSPEAIMAILAVLKSGSAFVPVDPDHPRARNDHILADAGVSIILTRSEQRQKLSENLAATILEIDTLDLGSEPDKALCVLCDEHRLAYVIYTSGSTGLPKGVAVEHGPLSRHCQSTARVYEMTEQSRELAFLPFSSDGGHERWMVPLMVGGSVVLPDRLWTPEETFAAMRRHRVNNASFPTAYLQQLAEWAEATGDAPPVRLYSFGGEGLAQSTFALLSRALQAKWLINGYGPTEAIMTPMVWKVPAGTQFEGMYAPIGRGVGQRRIYILDDDLNVVPIGVTGELYIGGDGLARGYFGTCDQRNRFLPDPFGTEADRLYRTGDLARWLRDGSVEFLGRADHQVKLRGYRIELGEIESLLRREPSVNDCAVVLRQDTSNSSLVAYVVPASDTNLEPSALRASLARHLPDYMVPSAVVVLPSLPLNANSKVDRAALPAPGVRSDDLVMPATTTETALASIWQEVLGIERVGVTQNFFEIGGHSMAALRILSRIKLIHPSSNVSIADMFNYQDIRSLAAIIDRPREKTSEVEIINLCASGSRPMLYCFPGLLVSTREYVRLVDYLGPDQPATGFLCYSLSEERRIDSTVEEITARYVDKIRRESNGKPCFFLGWSWGGLLAFEAARMLAGEVDLRLIAMVDVCDMDTDFAVGAIPSFRPGERESLQARIEGWLSETPMRRDWERLLGSMEPQAYEQFLRFVGNSEEDLPVDGPAIGSREHTFFVLIDNALIFRRYRMNPFDCPIHSWAAEDSLGRGLNLIDWRRYSPRAGAAEIVAGTTHLHIIGATPFHARLALRLDAECNALQKP